MNLEKFWAHPKTADVKKQIQEDIISGEEEKYFLKKDEEDNMEGVAEKHNHSLFTLQTTEKLLEETDISPSEIYSWYSQAMQRRD